MSTEYKEIFKRVESTMSQLNQLRNLIVTSVSEPLTETILQFETCHEIDEALHRKGAPDRAPKRVQIR